MRLCNNLRDTQGEQEKKIEKEMRKDIRWWKRFLPEYNGTSLMWMEQIMVPDQLIASKCMLVGNGSEMSE